MGSGKTTAAQPLLDLGFSKFSFADPLKKLISSLYNLPLEDLYDPIKKQIELDKKLVWDAETAKRLCVLASIEGELDSTCVEFNSLRHAMQYIGTDVLRKYDDNFHINMALASLDPNKNYVCDDVRYPNELSALQKLGGYCIFIIRPNYFQISNHKSETSLTWNMLSHISINKNKEIFVNDIKSFSLKAIKGKKNLKLNTHICNSALNAKAFLEPDSSSAFYAGILYTKGIVKKSGKYNYVIKLESDYSTVKLFKEYIYSEAVIKTRLVKSLVPGGYNLHYSITFDSPFLIENLKRWDIKPDKEVLEIPNFIKGNSELTDLWLKGSKRNS